MARRLVYPAAQRTTVKTNNAANVSGLNPEQAIAASHLDGPMVVQAQAGSGKTHTLIELCGNLVKSGVDPKKILAVTFSKKAADEMNARGNKKGYACTFSTWHAFALNVLKEDQTTWAKWEIDESDRAKYAVKDALSYKHLDWKDADLGQIRRYITFCKAHNATPDSPKAAELAKLHVSKRPDWAVRAYAISQDLIETAGLLTFDDMLCYCAQWLSNEENRKHWAAKFSFVIQDEAQDSNPVQTEIAELLTRDSGNYIVVGDPAQSIYGFRGSSPEAITSFARKYPNARVVTMNRNYRSGSAIIDVANKVIAPAKVRLPTDMIAECGSVGSARCIEANNLDDEANEFRGYVQNVYAEGGRYSDTTCLFRTNAQSRALEEALLSAQIPYIILGGTSFYERKEVKDILGYLRVASGADKDGEGLKRCLNAPFRFLGAKFVEKVSFAKRPELDWVDAVSIASRAAGIQARQKTAALEWAERIAEVATGIKNNETPDSILTNLVAKTRFIEWLSKDEGGESLESSHAANVRELIRVSARFKTVEALLTYINKSIQAASKQRKEANAGGDRVLLMSIHRSKGLEWKNVWVVGLNEKILPHAMGDIEEERRLAYVAFTRAKENLTVSWVTSFTTGEGLKPGHPSPFLLDAGLIDGPQGLEC